MTELAIDSSGSVQASNAGRSKSRLERWSWLAKATTALLGVSLATGLYLYLFAPMNWNAGQFVLGVHLAGGIAATALFIAWQFEHLMKGLKLARNRLFLYLSWIFLVLYSALLISGLVNATPFFLYLVGIVWFYKFETTDLIATIHLYLAIATAACFVAHLLLPHWPRKKDRS